MTTLAPEASSFVLPPAGRNREPSSVPCTFINRVGDLYQLADALRRCEFASLDTETEFRPEMDNDGVPGGLRVISIATRDREGTEEAFVLDMRDLPTGAVAELLVGCQFDAWNANFDELVLWRSNLDVALFWDCQLADIVLYQGRVGITWYHGLAWAAKNYLGITGLDGKGTTQLSYDLTSELTTDQIRYAGVDAVTTLWVAAELRRRLAAVDLVDTAGREIGARSYINDMMQNGIAFEIEDWLVFVHETHGIPKLAVEQQIADLVAPHAGDKSVQPDLWGTVDLKSLDFKVGSAEQCAQWLNKVCPDAVRAVLKRLFIAKVDPVDDATLKMIDHPLAKLLLTWRGHEKVISTYGENLRKFWSDGRLRSRYKQGLVATGRMASDKPNAQNFDKAMKKRSRPKRGRVYVYADLSQAELRYGAHIAVENAMIESFKAGRDLHEDTATRMFGVDVRTERKRDRHWFAFTDECKAQLDKAQPDALDAEGQPIWHRKDFWETSDYDRLFAKVRELGCSFTDERAETALEHKRAAKHANDLRSKAKTLNFGILYGLGARSLSVQLTNNGVPTSVDEAKELLARYAEAYPAIDAWLLNRDRIVDEFADSLADRNIDWDKTFRLYRLRKQTDAVVKALRKKLRRVPDPDEIAYEVWPEMEVNSYLSAKLGTVPTPEDMAAEWQRRIDAVAWARTFEGAAVIDVDEKPVCFESRTLGNRRRVFEINTEHVLEEACFFIVNFDNKSVVEAVDEFARTWKNSSRQRVSFLTKRNDAWVPKSRDELRKVFEDRKLRWDLVSAIRNQFRSFDNSLTTKIAASVVRGMKNQHRNAPIQGGVADVVLDALAELNRRIRAAGKRGSIWAVQSVHDSVTLESDVEDAEWLAWNLKDCLEGSLEATCPSVPAKADCDIRISLADDDVVGEFQDGKIEWSVDLASLQVAA